MFEKSLSPTGLYRICAAPPRALLDLARVEHSNPRAEAAPDAADTPAVGSRRGRAVRFGAWFAALSWRQLRATYGRPGRLQTALLLGLGLLSAPARADIADAVQAIKPSVVGVGTYHPTGNPRVNLQGTGFVVLDGRYIVSCAHIFAKPLDSEKNETHAVFLGRDRQIGVRPATLIATDKSRDLALLKITGDPLPALKLGNSETAREGWQLYFTGYPLGSILGLNPSTHRAGLAAIIPIFTPQQHASQLNARTLRQALDPYEVFELDAIAYPGNSGSPVWNPETGEVLGIVNSVYVKGSKDAALTAPSGLSYAIPAKYIQRMLDQATRKP